MTVNALNFRKDYFTNQNRLKVTLWGCHAPPLGFLVLAAFWVGVGVGGGGALVTRSEACPGSAARFLGAGARDAGCGRGPPA